MKDNKIFNLLIAILTGLLVVLIVAFSVKSKELDCIRQSGNFRDAISVSGLGEIFVEPDMGVVVLAVSNESKKVEDALTENSRRSNKVIEFIKSQGIDEKSIKSVGFNINPRYEYYQTTEYPSGRRVLTGYQVFHGLEIKVKEIDKVGAIIEGAIEAGANEASDIRFVIEDEKNYRDEARSIAVADAKTKAQKLADELGVDIVKIIGYSEGNVSPISLNKEFRVVEEFALSDSSLDLQSGENLIRSNVTIVYEIR
ncbi:MAG: SIMPL domain-containing protein [Minisyncoccales bacterium]|jgi:uncharacterized protein YggE